MDHAHHDHAKMMMNMSTTMSPMMDHDHHAHHNHDHSAMNHSNHGTSSPGNHMGHGNHGGAASAGHHMMMMYFHASEKATILFEPWQTNSWGGMLGSCIAIFIMAALYEGLKVFREHLLRKSNIMVRYNTMPVATSEDMMVSETHKTVQARMCTCAHLIQTLLHILQVVISYFLMLIFMTYNVYLCIAVALGAGAGYFLFGWRRAIVVDINEHCH